MPLHFQHHYLTGESSVNKWLGRCVATIVPLGVIFVFFYSLMISQDTTAVQLENRFLAPSGAFLFGTDELGRSVLSRTIAGFRYSFSLVLLALSVSACIGALIGLTTGFFHSQWLSRLMDQTVNIIWSIPGLIFFIAVTTYFGRNFFTLVLCMAMVSWVPVARVVRLEVQGEKKRGYVLALKALGYSNTKILLAIVPNILTSFVVVVLSVALDLIAAESGLSFLGLGIQPPYPSLGSMIYNGLVYSSSGWWMLVFPLLALLALAFLLMSLMIFIKVHKGTFYNEV